MYCRDESRGFFVYIAGKELRSEGLPVFYETYKIRVQAPNAIRQHKTIEVILFFEKKAFLFA